MNNLLRIRTLTDKFYDGDTTPEEEQELYDFYRQDDIPEDLRPNQELFRLGIENVCLAVLGEPPMR